MKRTPTSTINCRQPAGMSRLATLAFLSILASTTSFAQGGSYYSALGVGDIRRNVGALYDAFAGTSIAMPTTHGINTVNPALLGMTPYTRLQAGYRFNQFNIQNGDRSTSQNNGEIDGLLALFSIDTAAGFGITLGVLPYSTVNYASTRTITIPFEGSTITGRSNQTGEGGMSRFILGASARVVPSLYVGLMVQGFLGTTRYTDQVLIDGTGYNSITSASTYDVRGLMGRAGLYFKITDDLSIGAILSAGADASVRRTDRVVGVTSTRFFVDTSILSNTTTALPFTLGGGISWKTGKFLLGADVEYSDLADVTVHTRPDATLGSSMHISAAVSRPGDPSTSAPYLDRWGYHGGIGYDKSYVTYAGSSIADYYASIGVDLPVGGSAILDLALQGGRRARGDGEGLSELYAKMTFTLSIGETWFKPFARE